VLVWINGLMAVMRYRAGDIVHRISPTGLLLASAVLSGVGLLGLSYVSGGVAVFAAATVFALGVCYFWPTMLGVVSERVPKSGALGLGLMGTVGMATVGLVAAPQMGRIADRYAHDQIPVSEVITVFERTSMVLGNSDESDARDLDGVRGDGHATGAGYGERFARDHRVGCRRRPGRAGAGDSRSR